MDMPSVDTELEQFQLERRIFQRSDNDGILKFSEEITRFNDLIVTIYLI